MQWDGRLLMEQVRDFAKAVPGVLVTVTGLLDMVAWQTWVTFLTSVYLAFQVAHYLWVWNNERQEKERQEKRRKAAEKAAEKGMGETGE